MSILDLQRQYNLNLTRMKRAEDFMNSDASHEDKNKWLPEFVKLKESLSQLIKQIEVDQETTPDEIEHGFNAGGMI